MYHDLVRTFGTHTVILLNAAMQNLFFNYTEILKLAGKVKSLDKKENVKLYKLTLFMTSSIQVKISKSNYLHSSNS